MLRLEINTEEFLAEQKMQNFVKFLNSANLSALTIDNL